MKSSANVLIKLVTAIKSACRNARIPAYSCRKSKHTYRQRQHIAIVCLMKYMRLNYRSVVQLLEIMQALKKMLGLERLPHYTTIQKFFMRFSRMVMERLLVQTALLSGFSGIIAIDSTGFTSSTSSRHYQMFGYKTDRCVWKDAYMKGSVAVDLESRAVIALKCRTDHAHDSVDFIPVLVSAKRNFPVKTVIADRGYDSEHIHEFARESLGIRTLIPVRQRERSEVSGRYRIKLSKRFDWKTYGRRSTIESIFSVIERKFGDTLRSRSRVMREKELGLVCVVYNIYRHNVCLLLDVFYTTV